MIRYWSRSGIALGLHGNLGFYQDWAYCFGVLWRIFGRDMKMALNSKLRHIFMQFLVADPRVILGRCAILMQLVDETGDRLLV